MAEKNNFHPHIGFSGILIVLTIGLILMLMNIGFSLGLTFRIPKTDSNLMFVGCLGEKNKAINSLPPYAKNHLASNNDFINHSMTTTIWKIEGCEMGIIGNLPGSPALGIHFAVK